MQRSRWRRNVRARAARYLLTILLLGAVSACGEPPAEHSAGQARTLTYEIYGGPAPEAPSVMRAKYVVVDWTDWFHIVLSSAPSVGPTLGAWTRHHEGVNTKGYISGPGGRPYAIEKGGQLREEDVAPDRYRGRSTLMRTDDLRDAKSVDEQGKASPIPYRGQAPNALMNGSFVWERALPHGYAAASRLEIPVLLLPWEENDFTRVLTSDEPAAEVERMLGIKGLRAGYAKPTACEECDALMAVWHPEAELPLFAAEVSQKGGVRGMLVHEWRAAQGDVRYLATS